MGKRMRGDAANAVAPRAEVKSFWYLSMIVCYHLYDEA